MLKIDTGILFYGPQSLLYSNSKECYLTYNMNPHKLIHKLEFAKGLTPKELEKYMIYFFARALFSNNSGMIRYLRRKGFKISEEESRSYYAEASKIKAFDIVRTLYEEYKYELSKEIIEKFFKYGNIKDVEFILSLPIFESGEITIKDVMISALKGKNKEVFKYLGEKYELKYDSYLAQDLLYECRDLDSYKYLISIHANKDIPFSIGREVDRDLVKYLADLDLEFEKYNIEGLFEQPIEVIDYILKNKPKAISKEVLDKVLIENRHLHKSEVSVYLMKKGIISKSLSLSIVVNYLYYTQEEEDVDLMEGVYVTLDKENRKLLNSLKDKAIVKYFIYLNRDQFKNNKLIGEYEKLYKLVQIKKRLILY